MDSVLHLLHFFLCSEEVGGNFVSEKVIAQLLKRCDFLLSDLCSSLLFLLE